MLNRSSQPMVRNPVLELPAMAKLQALPPAAKAALVDLLEEIRQDADGRAQRSWEQRKGPMAAYWRSVATYALHIRRGIVRLSR